jgi:murein DD-endopeptidase MepM/ murein hydrolase activator NlpD
MSPHPRRYLRHLPARLASAIALALPATAIAAPAADDSRPPEPASVDGGGASGVVGVIATVGGFLAQEGADEGPFNPVDAPVDYGTSINRFGGGGMRTHEGQDMFAPEGTPVVSPVATKVLETGSDGGRGNWAALYDAASDRTYVYMHMEEPAMVGAGDDLGAGEQVGELGCTGSCDGPHLHFEIRAGADPYGPATDPLRELQSWRTLPGG